jgi:DNA-binding MarR family transcriptional regulator
MKRTELSRKFIEVIPKTMCSIRQEMREVIRSSPAGRSALCGRTFAQFRVLAQLRGQPMSNRELAEATGSSIPAMSRMVESLVKKGLVERRLDTADRRQVVLTLTSEGLLCFEQLTRVARGRFSRRFTALSDDKKSQLVAGLQVLEELFGKGAPV